jgi:hypothetical protein
MAEIKIVELNVAKTKTIELSDRESIAILGGLSVDVYPPQPFDPTIPPPGRTNPTNPYPSPYPNPEDYILWYL